jgi:hypothetical protein
MVLMGLMGLLHLMVLMDLTGLLGLLGQDEQLNKHQHLQLNTPSLLGHLEYLNILDT